MVEMGDDVDLQRNFENRLLSEDKQAFIPHVFQKHGFDASAAMRAMAENDLRIEPERSSWFSSLTSL
jgi:hypothetical protein